MCRGCLDRRQVHALYIIILHQSLIHKHHFILTTHVIVRYQALFRSRQLAPSGEAVVATLSAALAQEKSVLMRHEMAYVLGQNGHPAAVPVLIEILENESEDEVTRHEAAEGLAAIGTQAVVEAQLSKYAHNSEMQLLAETCQLALEATKRQDEPGALPACVCQQYEKVATERSIEYISKDPAVGLIGATHDDIGALGAELQREDLDLYARYQAMFTLRNLGGSEAVKHLCDGLLFDKGSACFRHEVAFVLGQMENELATEALLAKLAEHGEHPVVRHEAAIALGSIGGEVVVKALEVHSRDSEPMVAESCVAALATVAYWEYWEKLEARLQGEAC